MKLLLIYWAFLVAGYIAGGRLRAGGKHPGALGSLMMITVYGLCFFMGMRMGVNEQVTSNLGMIGLEALFITLLCIAGSMLAIFALRKILRMDRYGNFIRTKDRERKARADAETPQEMAAAEAVICWTGTRILLPIREVIRVDASMMRNMIIRTI